MIYFHAVAKLFALTPHIYSSFHWITNIFNLNLPYTVGVFNSGMFYLEIFAITYPSCTLFTVHMPYN